MEIAYVYDAIYPWVKGGAEKRIYELSTRLASRGHTVHCYGIKWWPGEDEILRDGVRLHGICKPRPLYVNGRRSIREAAAFAADLLARPPREAVVDCQNFPYLSCFSTCLSSRLSPHLPPRFLSRLSRWEKGNGQAPQRLFITWHEVWGEYWYDYLGRRGAAGRIIERAAARLTDCNIAVSRRTKRNLEGLGAKGVQLLPNGIDWQRIDEISPSPEGSDIIFAGRLAAHKNIDQLILAVGMIRSELPDVQVAIIGDGPERERLRSLTRRMNLDENIRFYGFMESYNDALALMKSSRAFASPSTREGFGMAALDANACGLPVVTVEHRMNAVMDLVRGDTGFICPLRPQALAEALLSALRESDRMRIPCQELARSYDWERICDRAERIYEEGQIRGEDWI